LWLNVLLLTAHCSLVSTMSLPLVSVLTPVYNGEKYLAECIESVLAQTYRNWEYVIVNNCSTDKTVDIAQYYAEQDQRIRIHHNERFVDRIENHNIALRLISFESKYCKILHADDCLFPECIIRMVELAEANPSVGIVGAYGLEGVRVKWDGLAYPSPVTSGRELCRRSLLGGLYVFGSPSSILFCSDAVRSRKELYISDEFGSLYADQDACYQILQNSDFGFVHQVLTYSRIHDESVTSVAASTSLNHDLPAQLNILRKYGPTYLSKEEYEAHLDKVMQRYYSFLGQSVFYFKSNKFWDFHAKALRYMGLPLNRIKVLQAACSEVLDTLLNPLKMAVGVVTHLARSFRRYASF
jgi:glycosyltransferase involved in cell wall biosynthesis